MALLVTAVRGRGPSRLTLFADNDFAISPLDRITGDVVECRRSNRCSRAQVEAGVVPWAADGRANNQPFCERPTVMRAVSGDCEDIVTASHKHDRLTTRMAEELLAVG
jgi:hypothetical protein